MDDEDGDRKARRGDSGVLVVGLMRGSRRCTMGLDGARE